MSDFILQAALGVLEAQLQHFQEERQRVLRQWVDHSSDNDSYAQELLDQLNHLGAVISKTEDILNQKKTWTF